MHLCCSIQADQTRYEAELRELCDRVGELEGQLLTARSVTNCDVEQQVRDRAHAREARLREDQHALECEWRLERQVTRDRFVGVYLWLLCIE